MSKPEPPPAGHPTGVTRRRLREGGGPAVLAVLLLAAHLGAVLCAAQEQGSEGRQLERRSPPVLEGLHGLLLAAESGEPLTGAEVVLEALPPRRSGPREEPGGTAPADRGEGPAGRARSDRSGAFALDLPSDGPWRVVVRPPGRVAVMHELLPGSGPRALAPVRVPVARSLSIRVVAGSGEPVAAASVTLLATMDLPPWRQPDGSGWRPLPRHGRTGPDGRLTFPVAEGEEVWVSASAPALELRQPLHLPAEELADRRPVTVRLAPAAARPAGSVSTDGPGARAAVTGRLVGSRGEAVRGWVWTDPDPGAAVAADSDGRFRLPLGSDARWIVAADRGRLSRVAPIAELPAVEPVELRLAAAAELAGRTLDPAGRPVAGARIETVLPDAGRAEGGRALERLVPERPAVTWSDGEGRFRLGGLPVRGRYPLVVSHPGFRGASLEVPAAGVARLEVVLEPSRTAVGAVLSPDERPVAGAEVTLEPAGDPARRPPHRARTGDDGGFEIAELEPGRWDLVVRHPRFATSRVPGLVVPRTPGPVDLGTVVLGRGTELRGTVVDPDGQPVEGARVRAASAGEGERGGERGPLYTDAAGEFVLRGLSPGSSVDLRVDHPDHVMARIDGVELPRPEALTVVLEDGFGLAGRVVDEDGSGAAGARVRLEPVAGGAPRPEGRSGADGRFALDGVAAGSYRAVAGASGFADSEPVAVEVGPEAAFETIELVLRRGAVVLGRVLAPDGTPVPEAPVRLVASTSAAGSPPEGRSDADGGYRLEGVEEGRRLLEARHPEYPPRRIEVEVAPGENRQDLVFEPGVEVTGRVIAADGAPVGGASLELSDGGPPDATANSAPDGGFRLHGVAPGIYRLRARHPGHTPALVEGVEVPATGLPGLEVVLEPGTVLAGRVLGLELDDLGRLVVRATDATRHLLSGEVDYSGAFHVDGASPGDWFVSGELPDGRSAEAAVSVAPGERRVAVDLEFSPGAELRGRVVLAGEPLAEAEVGLSVPGSRPGAVVLTGHQGRFRLTGVPSGGGVLTVVHPERGVSHRQQVPPGAEEVLVDLPGASLEGVVRTAAGGAPVPGARVVLERDGGPEPVQRRVRTGPDGAFRVPDLQTGGWRVEAVADGFAPSEAAVELSAGASVRVALDLERSAGLEVALRLPTGAVPATVHAVLVGSGGRAVLSGTYAADAEGRIRPDAPAGSWTLLAAAPGTATLEVPIRAPGSEGPFRLPAGGTLDVELPGPDGPGPDARLTVEGPDGRPLPVVVPGGRLAITHPVIRGRARVGGLPPGGWTVRAVAADGSLWSGHATVVAGTTTPILLTPESTSP